MLNIISLILGVALLVAGRNLFWLFVGAAGFVTGMQLATQFWQGPELLAIIIGLVVGVIFALLAIFLQSVAIGIAGFLAGGYILTVLAGMIGLNQGAFSWIVYIIGGIIGVLLVIFLFDWAIITLSSLAGASLITQALLLPNGIGGVIFIALVIVGVVIQGSMMQREKVVVV
ncbi:MAG TPA: hypothetical protein VGA72_17105 [Anaerolineales bacterium]